MSTGWSKLDAPELVDILRNIAQAFVAYDGSGVDTRDEVFEVLERAGVANHVFECLSAKESVDHLHTQRSLRTGA